VTTTIGSETVRRGIPTTYRGARFRSRLEARWAAFFDLVEWSWVYEPFDADGWIPDFLIRGPWPFLVEVGPCVSRGEYVAKGDKARAAYPTTRTLFGTSTDGIWLDVPEGWTLVAGVTPVYEEPGWRATAAGFWAVTPFGESDEARAILGEGQPGFWHRCDECGRLGVESPELGYLRPCGHVTPVRAASGSPIFDLWSEAGNVVQWRGR
jgi:hypothetical protein